MLLVFQIIFTAPVITQIKSIGGGWMGGGVGSQRWVKATIWTQAAVLCPQHGTCTGTIHRVGHGCRQEQPGTPCSPINAPQGREMHPRGLTASVKSRL